MLHLNSESFFEHNCLIFLLLNLSISVDLWYLFFVHSFHIISIQDTSSLIILSYAKQVDSANEQALLLM